jgi:drug/metabolite transporter (DMT)-like permease
VNVAIDRQEKTSLGPKVILALVIVYTVWGSTYLAIDLTLATMPPFLMTGMRFLVAGALLTTFLVIRGDPLPTRRQWLNCALIGALMQGGCVGGIAIAERTITSGLASVGIATVPIWTALLTGLMNRNWPGRSEFIGIGFGFIGVIMLNVEGGLAGASRGAAIIVVAALCWSLGSVLSQRMDLPKGPMAFGGEMLMGGTLTALAGLASGERIVAVPSTSAILSWVYLVVAGSLGAYTAYMYLVRTVRISVATSYTLVTPIVAVLLGAMFQSEKLSLFTVLAVLTVLCGVGFIFKARTVEAAQSTSPGPGGAGKTDGIPPLPASRQSVRRILLRSVKNRSHPQPNKEDTTHAT